MRTAIVVSMVVVGWLTAGTADAGRWRTVEIDDGGFAVAMPGKPARQKCPDDQACEVHFLVYGGKRGKPSYVVSWNDFTAEAAAAAGDTADAMLATTRDQLVTSSGGDLVEDAAVIVDGHPGHDFVIGLPELGAMMFVRAVVVDRRLYQVIYTAEARRLSDADRKRFAASFRMLPAR
jgi:hypothetical protein